MVRVLFKEEDERDGVAWGPVFVTDESGRVARPFDPERDPEPWVSRIYAVALARRHGVVLEES